MATTNYLCGNCCTPIHPFTDTEGNTGQECPACKSLWYAWELERAIRWQQEAEERNAKRLANRALKKELQPTGNKASVFGARE